MTDALRALEVLMGELFDGDELRRFVTRGYGRSMMMELPGGGATGAETVHQFAQLLQRHNQIDDGLFGMIAAERPEARGRVREVAQLLGHGVREMPKRIHGEGLPEQVVDEIFGRLLAERDAIRRLLTTQNPAALLMEMFGGTDSENLKVKAAALREVHLRALRPDVLQLLAGPTSLASIAGSSDTKLDGAGAFFASLGFLAVLERLAPFGNTTEAALWQLANEFARSQVHQLSAR